MDPDLFKNQEHSYQHDSDVEQPMVEAVDQDQPFSIFKCRSNWTRSFQPKNAKDASLVDCSSNPSMPMKLLQLGVFMRFGYGVDNDILYNKHSKEAQWSHFTCHAWNASSLVSALEKADANTTD
ncbi:hypothetical protein V6N13_091084 [Hibiscus sabdariffa]